MAVRIPIITVFDSKGLKSAEYQLRKVSGNISALSRNLAIAGTVASGIAFGLGKATMAASNFEAEFEGVNQVFKESAKLVQDFANSAAETAGLSATEALRGAKTFGLFATSAGLSTQEAAKFSTTLVQLAGDLGSFNDVPTEEALQAIQSGLMGQAEPLRKFGVFLTDNALRAEAMAMKIYDGTGALTAQQKMLASYNLIMRDTQIQQGDFVKYQDTLGNQLKTISSEFDNLVKDIGMELIPVIAAAMPTIRDLGNEFGEKLKGAIESIDWESLITAITNLITVFVENIETIVRVTTVLFLLNTAYHAGKVAVGLYNAAAAYFNFTLGLTTTAAGVATGALTVLRTAMLLSGIGATVVVLGLIADAFFNVSGKAKEATGAAKTYRDTVTGIPTATSNYIKQEVAQVDGIKNAWKNAKAAADAYKPTAGRTSVMDDYAYNLRTGQPTPKSGKAQTELDKILAGAKVGGGSSAPKALTLSQQLKREGTIATKEAKLISKGLSEGLASKITSSATPIKAANAVLKKITSTGGKAATKLQNQFNKTKAGQQELANVAAQAQAAQAQAAAQAEEQARELARIQEEQVRAQEEQQRLLEEQAREEQRILEEKERIYNSFLDSVKNVFAQIKDSITGAFDLPKLGGSTDSIIRNMKKLLDRVRSFSGNITKLAAMGLSPELLQQVIAAGPVAGARLAASLVAGGAGALAQINEGFGEISSLASGIATTGATARFDNPTQQNIYNINVDGGVGSGATIGQAIVEAIKAYERTSGAVWQGA
jgi:hypothetical protein